MVMMDRSPFFIFITARSRPRMTSSAKVMIRTTGKNQAMLPCEPTACADPTCKQAARLAHSEVQTKDDFL